MKELNDFTSKFTDKQIENVILNRDIYYLTNPDLRTMSSKIEIKPITEGIPLGKKGKYFMPSVYLLEILSKLSTNKIYVNDKAEWLFLCGRDIFESSILKNESERKTFLVQNMKDENLGYAEKIKKGKNILIKNKLDRGDFLRRER